MNAQLVASIFERMQAAERLEAFKRPQLEPDLRLLIAEGLFEVCESLQLTVASTQLAAVLVDLVSCKDHKILANDLVAVLCACLRLACSLEDVREKDVPL